MGNPLILTFDIGTQSMRAMLVNKQGDIVALAQNKYERPYISKNPGWAEQRPDFYFDHLCDLGRQVRDANAELMKDVKAVAMTVIRDTALCLDKNNKAIRDIIIWLDKRETTYRNPIPRAKSLLFKMVNMEDTIKMQQRQSACNWIMENEPEVWAETAKYVMLPTYLNCKLTGVLNDSVASMIGHIPMDFKNRKWLGKSGLTRFVFDIPNEKLCDLVQPGEVLGYITKEVSEYSGIPEGLPLIATGADKSCETLGLSVMKDNQAAISLGSAATIQFPTKTYFEPKQFIPSYPSVVENMYLAEIQVYRGYWMLSWFKKEFAYQEVEEAKKLGCCPEDVLNKKLHKIPAGCDGLMVQPYWGAGLWNPNARGSMLGFTDTHTKMHVYRAVIEGINFALLDGMYGMEKRSKHKITELYVGGGGSQSDEICQITANMFGLPVKRIQTHEACGLGASLIAFKSIGEFESFDQGLKSMVHDKDVFTPDMEEHKIYAKMYKECYVPLLSKIDPWYKKLKKITKREVR